MLRLLMYDSPEHSFEPDLCFVSVLLILKGCLGIFEARAVGSASAVQTFVYSGAMGATGATGETLERLE